MNTRVLSVKGGRHEVVSISPKAELWAASLAMNQHNIGALIVVDETGDVVGIVSERDIARSLYVHEQRTHRVLVRDIMTVPVVTIDEGASVIDASRMMAENSIRHLLVTAGSGGNVGVVSATDLLRALAEHFAGVADQYEKYIMGG